MQQKLQHQAEAMEQVLKVTSVKENLEKAKEMDQKIRMPHRELCRQREPESRIFVACAATSMWSQISTFRTDQQKIR